MMSSTRLFVRAINGFMTFLPQQGEQFYDDERPYYDEYGNDPCLDRISPNFIFQHFSIGFKLSVQFVIYVSSFAIRIFTMAHAARFFSYPEIQFLCLWRQICTISN